ncbi:ABC transporter ATP-binding protein [Desulfobacterales bacterium HSG16]|nr:ABC transporter ATP-binding protein [Desulfobacterales bacterium HSG16]
MGHILIKDLNKGFIEQSKKQSMGHVIIKNLNKEFIDRRKKSRCRSDAVPKHNRIPVLDNINLEFLNGEMVCILGPSGCGKSTLLRIVAGFDNAFSGNVLIDGKAHSGPSSDHIFVFQHSSLFPWMTVKENVELGLRAMKDQEEKEEKIQEYIDIVDLGGFEMHYPHQLSGGMQRRAELARALAVNPDILFMDEPFSGLDFLTHMRAREEVVNVHQFIGITMLIVTHDIDDALVMGDRIIVFSSRPARVKMARKLDFPRPRDFEKQPELNELRSEIFLMLGVPHAV